MNITLIHFFVGLLLLVVPLYLFWWLDKRLLRQAVVVVGRLAATLVLLTVCLHFLFLWDKAWLNVVWVLVAGGVATYCYCRKRWLYVPVYIGMSLSALLVGIVVTLLCHFNQGAFSAPLFIPVMSVLQADALFVCRQGLTAYVLNIRQHGSLKEYLKGNGISERDALRPFVAAAVKRAFTPVLHMMLLAGIVFVPSLVVGLLIGGISPMQAVGFTAVMTAAGLCCSVLALLVAIYFYICMKK